MQVSHARPAAPARANGTDVDQFEPLPSTLAQSRRRISTRISKQLNGGVDWPSAAASLARYLTALEQDTRRAITEGTSIDAAVKIIAASALGAWTLFDDYNGRNAAEAYKELEWE